MVNSRRVKMEKIIRILLLEDNPSDSDLIKYELRKNKLKFSIIETKNKSEFIKAIENNLPDLVLSDFNLPDIDGEEALRILRDKDNDIPFILVSANIGEEKAVELMRNGANDFVMKDKLARLSPAIIRELQEYENRINAKKEHEELEQYKEQLEELVEKRTKELTEKNIDLERLNKLFVNREHRIKELRDELKKYEK
jgi:two-component system sensor histidine kinase UhpB